MCIGEQGKSAYLDGENCLVELHLGFYRTSVAQYTVHMLTEQKRDVWDEGRPNNRSTDDQKHEKNRRSSAVQPQPHSLQAIPLGDCCSHVC